MSGSRRPPSSVNAASVSESCCWSFELVRLGRYFRLRLAAARPLAIGAVRAAVHPRAGGEHEPENFESAYAYGSSPRGRGTLLLAAHSVVALRFIPARAGNTRARPIRRQSQPVHPRAGGEHAAAVLVQPCSIGSSPRGRGTQCECDHDQISFRFIPARAGNTHRARTAGPRFPVHPRAGGEHASRANGWAAISGSSPRGRGTLFPQPDDSTGVFECQRAYQLEAAWISRLELQFKSQNSCRDSLHGRRAARVGTGRV